MSDFKQIVDRFSNAGNAAETAYAVLREAILLNVFSAGERLRADDLAKKLNISKTPVREALRKLQAENLVVEQGSGLAVRTITEEQLIEIYYTREALEGMVARLAAERAEHAEIAALQAIVAEMKPTTAPANLKKMRLLRREFYRGVLRAARNATLAGILRHLHDQIRQFSDSTMFYPGRPKEVIALCKSLLAAIEKRDPDEAERIARANRKHTLEIRVMMLRRQKAG
jgi:DNA-binding GntR family transcriptional regulator